MVFEASQSKVETWRRCKAAYHKKYVDKLRKKRKARPLVFGSLVHEMLQAYAEGDDPFSILDKIPEKDRKMFKSEREEYGDLVEDVRCIMEEYFTFWPEESLRYLRINKRRAEHEFRVEMKKGLMIVGKIDGVVMTPNKLKWLGEHKSFGNHIPGPDHRWRNLQSILYIRVMDILGYPQVEGTLWDYILSKPPSRPQFKKDGTLSAKKLRTLPSRVLATIKESNLDPKDYKTLLESAKSTRREWFQRIYTPIKRHAVDSVVADFLATVEEMAALHGKRSEKTIGRHCEWCDFEPLCRAELTGGDVDYVKDREFYVKTGSDRR